MTTLTEFRVKFRALLNHAKEDFTPEGISAVIDEEFANTFPGSRLPNSTHPALEEYGNTDQVADAMRKVAREINQAARTIAYGVMRREMSPQTIIFELNRLPLLEKEN
jgi:hypothetical protein